MADGTPGWVEVRLIGPKDDVKRLAQEIIAVREVRVDSGCVGPRDDGKYARHITVRDRASVEEAPDA